MENKKITIIGRGTAGCLTAAQFNHFWGGEVEWLYDPNIPTQSVGEGSQLSYPVNLYNLLDFTFSDLPKVDGSLKRGIRKVNWNGSGDFMHNFVPPGVSMHFNAVKMQDYVYQKLQETNIKIKEQSVLDHDQIDSDFIVDCSGRPKDYADFRTDLFVPVNAVHVTQCFWDEPKFDYTYTIARPYGWVFGIPLQNRCSIGYLYNANINTLEEVQEDVKQVFEDLNLTPSDTTNNFTFSNYFRKQNFTDRVAYNGNASFFLEPLEATSIHTMDTINRIAYNIFFGKQEAWVANLHYEQFLEETQQIIMLHYLAGSKYDTEFWNHAEQMAEICLRQKNDRLMNFVETSEITNRSNDTDFGSGWNNHSFRENLLGLDIRQKLLNLKQ
jgi:hypothetical protein